MDDVEFDQFLGEYNAHSNNGREFRLTQEEKDVYDQVLENGITFADGAKQLGVTKQPFKTRVGRYSIQRIMGDKYVIVDNRKK